MRPTPGVSRPSAPGSDLRPHAGQYARILSTEKGRASVKASKNRVERNPKYLVDVVGLDPDDSDEIVKVLRGKKGAGSWTWRK